MATRDQEGPIEGDFARFVQGAVAVIVATHDDDLMPAVTRGWGATANGDGSVVELCVGASPGTRTRANLQPGGPIAVTFSVPSSYVTVQLKGRLTAIADPSAEQQARVEAHIQAFGAAVELFGLTSELVRALACEELQAVTIAVDTRFDQTPGRGAGRAL